MTAPTTWSTLASVASRVTTSHVGFAVGLTCVALRPDWVAFAVTATFAATHVVHAWLAARITVAADVERRLGDLDQRIARVANATGTTSRRPPPGPLGV